MSFDPTVLTFEEKLVYELRSLFLSSGYVPFRMSKFEEYDFYAKNKDFLVSDQVITFTDTDGKLMALKPDVTLSIVKNTDTECQGVRKVFYNESVYRVSDSARSFREIMQTGLECIGEITSEDRYEVLQLAMQSVTAISPDGVLDISDLALIEDYAAAIGVPAERFPELLSVIESRNKQTLLGILSDNGVHEDEACGFAAFVSERVPVGEYYSWIQRCPAVIRMRESYDRFCRLIERISTMERSEQVYIDFSVTGDAGYYSGLIFKGYVPKIINSVLSGGQYDRLLAKLGRNDHAIGFAVYLDGLDRLQAINTDDKENDTQEWLRIALPKGRLGERVYGMLARAGLECPELLDPGRKLMLENPDLKLRYFWVKPSDVAIYVERGAADIGVVGKDILMEQSPNVYELLDLKTGICKMAVAAPEQYEDDPSKTLIVATKFAHIAKQYYQSKGRNIDIIPLNGSIELAPILSMSDVIVDIVETGITLRENHLHVIETVAPISARLISNQVSYKFKESMIREIVSKLTAIVEEQND